MFCRVYNPLFECFFFQKENNTGRIGLPTYPVTAFHLLPMEQLISPILPRGSFILASPLPPDLQLSLIFHFSARYCPYLF